MIWQDLSQSDWFTLTFLFQFVQDGDPQSQPPSGAGLPGRDLPGQRLLPAAQRGLQLPGPQLLPGQQMTRDDPTREAEPLTAAGGLHRPGHTSTQTTNRSHDGRYTLNRPALVNTPCSTCRDRKGREKGTAASPTRIPSAVRRAGDSFCVKLFHVWAGQEGGGAWCCLCRFPPGFNESRGNLRLTRTFLTVKTQVYGP